ncbi:MAG TPA: hypothetical protein VNM36_13920, partial [Gemmatimonadaceae bacterium]|nr:hypothetical protein [Gemmatimonadaceae bacterium]
MRTQWVVAATVAVAVFLSGREAGAQDPAVRRDTTADTSAARRDSLAKIAAERERIARLQAQKADTIKAPIARAEVPATLSIGEPFAWDRKRLASTGALTLGELIDRIAGV